MPNQVITKNYFADFDTFEFFFTTASLPDQIQLSFWGKDSAERLVAPHRLVTAELLGYDGATGATGATGVMGLKVGLALMGRLGTRDLLE